MTKWDDASTYRKTHCLPSYILNMPHLNNLLKRLYLPASDLNSYKPISSLSFISKVNEKVVFSSMIVHLNYNQLFNVFQLVKQTSSFYRNRSTESWQRNITKHRPRNGHSTNTISFKATPMLCSWTAAVYSLIHSHKLYYHLYADDTQM